MLAIPYDVADFGVGESTHTVLRTCTQAAMKEDSGLVHRVSSTVMRFLDLAYCT